MIQATECYSLPAVSDLARAEGVRVAADLAHHTAVKFVAGVGELADKFGGSA